MDPIEQFLSEQQQEGRWDSKGVFTAAANKGLSKLASYQLPRPAAWVLKMIQAGVAGGATSIEVEPARRGMAITYHSADLGTPEALRDSWTSPTATVSPAQKHLLVGLRAISVGQGRAVLVSWRGGKEPTRTLYWDGARLSDVIARKELRLFTGAQEELTFYVSATTTSDGLSWSNEIRELRDFSVTCPVPLFLQGERLGHFGMGDIVIKRKPLAFGFQPPQDGVPSLQISSPAPGAAADERTASPSAWLLYWTSIPDRSVACWAQHGVICQTVPFGPRSRFQLRLYLPGDHLETDMTGLHLRFPEDQPEGHGVSPAVRAALTSLDPSDRALVEVAERLNDGSRLGTWSLVGMLVLAGTCLIPVMGVAALGGACAGGAAVSLSQRYEEKRRKNIFLKELESWRPQLLAAIDAPAESRPV